jgi:hypothetical protein
VLKTLLDRHHKHISNVGNGTHEANGNASVRLSKSGSATKKHNDLLSLDEGKYKLIQKSLKTIGDMAAAHDGRASKVRATVLKLSNSFHNLTDQLPAFRNDSAANAKRASADKQERKGVLTSVNSRLEKLLNKQSQSHLQTGIAVFLEHKPYDDEMIENVLLTKAETSTRQTQSEKDKPLQVQVDALKDEVSAKDAFILSQTESLATLTATCAKVTANMVVAAAQSPAAKVATEAAPPPRQTTVQASSNKIELTVLQSSPNTKTRNIMRSSRTRRKFQALA